jgi:PAS domain S-box-containing protein
MDVGPDTPVLPHHLGRDDRGDVRWLFRQLPGAAWITDRDLRVLEIIGYVERNLGRPHQQILGLTVQDLAQTREPSDPVTLAHHAALSGTSSSLRYRLQQRWYEVHVEPLRDGDEIVGCIGAAVDITDRVKLEQRAAEAEASAAERQRRSISLLEATIESTADGILVVDRTGKIIEYNRRFLALWGVADGLAERRIDAELLEFVVKQLVNPGVFLERVHDLYSEPTREDLDVLEFKDGRVYERYSRPQYIDGEVVGRVWSFRDVTVRESLLRNAVMLADSSRLLGSLEAVPALESVGRLLVRRWDACAFDLFERGGRARIAVERDPARHLARQIAMEPTDAEVQVVDDRMQLQVPMRVVGREVGRLVVLGPPRELQREQDLEVLEEVARRCAVALENSRLYRAAKHQIRAREEFLAVASHEIRGPIASIRLAVEGLRTAVAPQATLVDLIDREERRLERLVDELLDLGRLQSGQMHLMIESVDLAVIVREVVSRHAPELERAHSIVQMLGDAVLFGRWDRTRLEQVVDNLVSNAIKFGKGRPIEVTLAQEGDTAILHVTDRGIGIPEDKLATIFEPFERAVPDRHYGGLGLGLYIVRAIVARLGGRISVRSTAETGTTFTVELPREVTQ